MQKTDKRRARRPKTGGRGRTARRFEAAAGRREEALSGKGGGKRKPVRNAVAEAECIKAAAPSHTIIKGAQAPSG